MFVSKTHKIDSTIETIATNGETGDRRVQLCCGHSNNEWLFWLQGNADPVLLCEDGTGDCSTSEWIESSGLDISEIVDAIANSPADQAGKEWAIAELRRAHAADM